MFARAAATDRKASTEPGRSAAARSIQVASRAPLLVSTALDRARNARPLNPSRLQAKLRIGAVNDPLEREADQIADRVMRAADAPNAVGDVQSGCPCRNAIQTKSADGAVGGVEAPAGVHDVLNSPGEPLDAATRSFFEPRFGRDFSDVRVHADGHAAQAAGSIDARAFTSGGDIVFGAGAFAPSSESGRHLLAHELVHVVQQDGADKTVRRQHVADTGFRYTPPPTVKRSIVEIQGIVDATPDGIYGEDTKRAVEKYQTKLKALGFYSDVIDGKWGNNTEIAHVAFAVSPTPQRKGYNCAGFALKDYVWHNLAPTKAIYATMTKLANCSDPCSPYFYKFWLWEVDLRVRDTNSGAMSPISHDFHTVSGQTDSRGNGPSQVMSKNGQRPVEGPKPPLDWEPKTGPVQDQTTGLPVPGFEWVILSSTQTCFCNATLP